MKRSSSKTRELVKDLRWEVDMLRERIRQNKRVARRCKAEVEEDLKRINARLRKIAKLKKVKWKDKPVVKRLWDSCLGPEEQFAWAIFNSQHVAKA